jgi:cell division transport system permease protein
VQSKASVADRLGAWRSHHQLVAVESFQRLLAQPLASALTWMVIGIALALPASLFVALDNLQQLTGGWDSAARISVYLHQTVTEDAGRRLGEKLLEQPEISDSSYLSSTEALEEFSRLSGFGAVLNELPENPLPAVVVVQPDLELVTADALGVLVEEIQRLPEVELAQMDVQWVQRLYHLMALGKRVALALAMLLGVGVLLVTGNTIRLAIEGRREEIEVVKLVGGTDAYVRRPFIYTGVWYGLGGGAVACIVLFGLVAWLDGVVANLMGLYDSQFELRGLGVIGSGVLILAGVVLGIGGAWLAVSRHLGVIQPR